MSVWHGFRDVFKQLGDGYVPGFALFLDFLENKIL